MLSQANAPISGLEVSGGSVILAAMSAIRILPDQVANQIAAGEVVERPVAVVKELVENSLDAGATRVGVRFNGGGKSLVSVEDNGSGMGRDDALLALERHATSKIRSAADMQEVRSFGFRGEALPSIASVSRFTLRTRIAEANAGTEILIHAGKHVHTRDCGMPVGTRIDVAQLFNSVPARRKFLKTDRTEAAHIIHYCRLAAVAHPEVAFTLTENGREVFRSPVCPTLRERVAEIFGKQAAGDLMEIAAEGEGLRLSGLVGSPGSWRSTRADLHTYVNRRHVQSRTLAYALIESYHTYLPKGRYPYAFLFLEIDPKRVDVNIHPAKREVRFREEGAVRRFVIESILARLREASARVRGDSRQGTPADADAVPAVSPPPAVPTVSRSMQRPDAAEPPGTGNAAESGARAELSRTPTRSAPEESTRPRPGGWIPLGIAHDRFVLYQSREGVVLLNWRAARARIRYERILADLCAHATRRQTLLFPVTLELDTVASAVLEEYMDFFHGIGFDVRAFGRQFFRLEAIPDWFDPAAGEQFVRDLVARVRERGIRPGETDSAREQVARLAAATAVRAESAPGPEAWESLAATLLDCRDPLTDPRGRPVFFEIGRAELSKRLGLE